ncbi:MAG: nitroreductase [Chlorobiales bacterium]|nr:nitroreductase [Chlorobiales bacterium]
MEFTQAIAARHSCRNFLDTPVDAATISSLVEMAQHSPSWGNTQPWRVWVAGGEVAVSIRQGLVARGAAGAPPVPDMPMPTVFEGEMKARYVEVGRSVFAVLGIERQDEERRNAHRTNNCNAFGAPVLVYITLPDGLTPYAMLDAGSFLSTFCLAAADRGLATCIQATLAHYPDIIRQHLPIPPQERIVVGVALGHADSACDINRFRSAREPVEKILTLTGF